MQNDLKDMEDEYNEIDTELTMSDNKVKDMDIAQGVMERSMGQIKKE